MPRRGPRTSQSQGIDLMRKSTTTSSFSHVHHSLTNPSSSQPRFVCQIQHWKNAKQQYRSDSVPVAANRGQIARLSTRYVQSVVFGFHFPGWRGGFGAAHFQSFGHVPTILTAHFILEPFFNRMRLSRFANDFMWLLRHKAHWQKPFSG